MDMRREAGHFASASGQPGLPARVAPPAPRSAGHHDERPPALLGLTTADAEGRSRRLPETVLLPDAARITRTTRYFPRRARRGTPRGGGGGPPGRGKRRGGGETPGGGAGGGGPGGPDGA